MEKYVTQAILASMNGALAKLGQVESDLKYTKHVMKTAETAANTNERELAFAKKVFAACETAERDIEAANNATKAAIRQFSTMDWKGFDS